GRFGPDFVTAHRAMPGARTPEQRQLTYDIAVDPGFEHWRRWYGEQLALLPSPQADALARRLRLDEHFWPVTFELAAGAKIRSADERIKAGGDGSLCRSGANRLSRTSKGGVV
ncbi:hypothetical protein KBX08_31875, partial [Micromonospora sp. H61]|uniref:hypothetical protein n=1 Tax=Micromonospora sp. H61 TaxID=2824888 RepID=UPI001B395620